MILIIFYIPIFVQKYSIYLYENKATIGVITLMLPWSPFNVGQIMSFQIHSFTLYCLPQTITGLRLGCQPPLLLQMARERPLTSWRFEADSSSLSVCRDKLDCPRVCDSFSPHDHEGTMIIIMKYYKNTIKKQQTA